MDIRVGEIRTLEAKSVTLNGFIAAIYINTIDGIYPTGANMFQPELMQVRAVLTRGGKQTTLYNLNLRELKAKDFFYTHRFPTLLIGHGLYGNGKAIEAERFGLGLMNLKGEDKIELEVELKAGFFDVECSLANSYVRIEPFKAIGIEYSIPVTTAIILEPNIETTKLVLGNGISKVLFYAKDSIDTPIDGQQAIASMAVRCDKINRLEKYIDLINRRYDEFHTQEEGFLRGENIMLHDGQILNNLEIDLDYLAGKITGSKYKILITREVTSAEQLAVAEATNNEHAYENAVAMGVKLTSAQVADYGKNNAIKAANLTA